MALPTVVINNSTGSDTAASGAGPATALFGTAAATAASTTVTLLVDNPDLSGVATDGSAVIWIGSSSGRQFSKITGTNNTAGVKTVTVETAYANTESGKNWGIGGKRATLDNANTRHLGTDILAGWTVDIQETGTSYTLTSVFTWTAPVTTVTTLKPCTVYSSSATRPIITTSTNSINLFGVSASDPIIFKHLSFTNTAGTKGSYAAGTGNAIVATGSGCGGVCVIDCIIDGCVCGVLGDNQVQWVFPRITVISTEIKNCTDRAIGAIVESVAGVENEPLLIDHCYLHDNTLDGVRVITGAGAIVITNSVISSNGGRGIYVSSTAASGGIGWEIAYNSIKGNTSAGIELAPSQFNLYCHENILVSNGDYAVKTTSSQSTDITKMTPPILINNAFYNNTNGQTNFCQQIGAITLTGDPFNSPTDFGLNATVGAGALCKAAALTALNASANTAGDLGAIPSGGGAASSSGVTAARIFTGM